MIPGVFSRGAALGASLGAPGPALDAMSAAADPGTCFHCGLPLESGRYEVMVEGTAQATCCRGCQAAAQTIVRHGLASYYRHRTAPAARNEPVPEAVSRIALYDLPEVQRGFVRQIGVHEKEATLLLEGITCAACVWLIEQRLAALHGVGGIDLNYAAQRARVRWDERSISLSTILRTVIDLGYRAQAYDGVRSDAVLRNERRTLMWRVFVAGFGMMQVMMYAAPAYVAGADMEPGMGSLMRWASLILTVPVMLWSAIPFYRGAWRDIESGRVGMDVPVSLGIVGAFAASVYATAAGAGEVYFDSVSMFVFLLLGARYLELTARAKAVRSQECLAKLTPAFARRLIGYPGGQREEVPVALLAPGDCIALRPGEAIPADGIVVEGESAADEALLTGEARPVPKRVGDRVIGGATNLHGPLVVRVERVGYDTVLAGIVRLMDRALAEKPAIALAADRAARWFVAGLLVYTLVAAGAWYTADPERALWVAISLLVVSCPCALSLATPTAISAASGALHRLGVLVTRGHALETLGEATHFVFDKTGTLTRGVMTLIGVIPLATESQDRCLALGARLEMQSEHPLGRAIRDAAGRNPGDVGVLEAVHNFPGRGIEGVVAGRRVRIGTPDFVAELNRLPVPDEVLLVSDEVTVIALGDEHAFLALMTFGDALRAHARGVVHELRAMGKSVYLLSGDRQQPVEHVAHQIGIAVARGGAGPEDKLAFVRELQEQGAVVAMVGDGINDAPVLARAQVSVALGGGTHLARSNADMIVMSDRIDALIAAVRVARRTRRVIRQNLTSAIAYNAIALPLATCGLVTPLIAALGMSLSSLMVVGNALRLLRLEPVVADIRAFLPAPPDLGGWPESEA